jgi:N-glycosylase/DNA lyase
MRHTWVIEVGDIEKVKELLDQQRASLFVRRRVERNLRDEKPLPSKDKIWHQMVACLLTTQQRSGPRSAVTRLILTKPFPLAYGTCCRETDVEAFTKKLLTAFGGLRRTNKIASELAANLRLLEKRLWKQTMGVLDGLRRNQQVSAERETADFIADHFAGFGPKQSRNLLQSLGLTRYEVPIDSRIIKWLNALRFPLWLSGRALADRHYYCIRDGRSSGAMPSVRGHPLRVGCRYLRQFRQ